MEIRLLLVWQEFNRVMDVISYEKYTEQEE